MNKKNRKFAEDKICAHPGNLVNVNFPIVVDIKSMANLLDNILAGSILDLHHGLSKLFGGDKVPVDQQTNQISTTNAEEKKKTSKEA